MPHPNTYGDDRCDVCGKYAEYDLTTEYYFNSNLTKTEYVHEYCFNHGMLFAINHPIVVFRSYKDLDFFPLFISFFSVISRLGFILIILVITWIIQNNKKFT